MIICKIDSNNVISVDYWYGHMDLLGRRLKDNEEILFEDISHCCKTFSTSPEQFEKVLFEHVDEKLEIYSGYCNLIFKEYIVMDTFEQKENNAGGIKCVEYYIVCIDNTILPRNNCATVLSSLEPIYGPAIVCKVIDNMYDEFHIDQLICLIEKKRNHTIICKNIEENKISELKIDNTLYCHSNNEQLSTSHKVCLEIIHENYTFHILAIINKTEQTQNQNKKQFYVLLLNSDKKIIIDFNISLYFVLENKIRESMMFV